MTETELALERLDKAIANVMESDRKVKELDAKIEEKKKLLRQGVFNIGDVGLLPLIW